MGLITSCTGAEAFWAVFARCAKALLLAESLQYSITYLGSVTGCLSPSALHLKRCKEGGKQQKQVPQNYLDQGENRQQAAWSWLYQGNVKDLRHVSSYALAQGFLLGTRRCAWCEYDLVRVKALVVYSWWSSRLLLSRLYDSTNLPATAGSGNCTRSAEGLCTFPCVKDQASLCHKDPTHFSDQAQHMLQRAHCCPPRVFPFLCYPLHGASWYV